MDITETLNPGGRTYALKGRFDAHQVPQFKARVEPLKDDVTLDFAEVGFVDSTGLAALVSLYKQAKGAGHRLNIVNIQDQVRVIFEITQLHQVLPLELV